MSLKNQLKPVRVNVTLQLYPPYPSFPVEEITRRLGTEPTESRNRGDTIVTRLGRTRVAPNSVWFLFSEFNVASTDVVEHLQWLFDRLHGRADELAALRQDGVTMWASCIVWTESGESSFRLSPTVVAEMNALGVEWVVSFVSWDEEE